jgi:hypothetical protein
MANTMRLCSVSWIDAKSLPSVGFWTVASAAISWPNRVLMGLAGTSNPEPPRELGDLAAFRRGRQFRALVSCVVSKDSATLAPERVIDPGYTPPFDRSQLQTRLSALVPIPDDPAYYAGESSALSNVVTGRLHPSSSLEVQALDRVLVSALVKFRAGAHTDAIGIKEAKSPVHVPWVWCEFCVVRRGGRLRLLARGSTFPSHAWYVDGKQVAKVLQMPVSASVQEPAISLGASKDQPLSPAANDRSGGAVVSHAHTLGGGKLVEVDLGAA